MITLSLMWKITKVLDVPTCYMIEYRKRNGRIKETYFFWQKFCTRESTETQSPKHLCDGKSLEWVKHSLREVQRSSVIDPRDQRDSNEATTSVQRASAELGSVFRQRKRVSRALREGRGCRARRRGGGEGGRCRRRVRRHSATRARPARTRPRRSSCTCTPGTYPRSALA